MAVKVDESKIKLRTTIADQKSDGQLKRRSITLSNITEDCTNEDLYQLGVNIKKCVDGDLTSVAKIKDDYLKEIEQ